MVIDFTAFIGPPCDFPPAKTILPFFSHLALHRQQKHQPRFRSGDRSRPRGGGSGDAAVDQGPISPSMASSGGGNSGSEREDARIMSGVLDPIDGHQILYRGLSRSWGTLIALLHQGTPGVRHDAPALYRRALFPATSGSGPVPGAIGASGKLAVRRCASLNEATRVHDQPAVDERRRPRGAFGTRSSKRCG